MKIRNMVRSIRALFDIPASMGHLVSQMDILADRVDNVGDQISPMAELARFNGAVEGIGIRRKFGGRIDVDFDMFLNSIGPSGEAELMRTIQSRKEAR